MLAKLIRAKSKRLTGKNIDTSLINNEIKNNSVQSKTPVMGSRSGFRNQAIKGLYEWREMPPTTLERLENCKVWYNNSLVQGKINIGKHSGSKVKDLLHNFRLPKMPQYEDKRDSAKTPNVMVYKTGI